MQRTFPLGASNPSNHTYQNIGHTTNLAFLNLRTEVTAGLGSALVIPLAILVMQNSLMTKILTWL